MRENKGSVEIHVEDAVCNNYDDEKSEYDEEYDEEQDN